MGREGVARYMPFSIVNLSQVTFRATSTLYYAVQIPRGLGNSQSYGGNVFSRRGLSTGNTFRPYDWLLPTESPWDLFSVGVDLKITK